MVYARAASPTWIAGMMRNGVMGAAEIDATLEHRAAFAYVAQPKAPHLLDFCFDAMVGNDNVPTVMARENLTTLAAVETCFTRSHQAWLWTLRRNSVAAALREAS